MQNNRRRVEILAAYTRPEMWEVAWSELVATQDNNVADTDYIAFIRTRLMGPRGELLPSMITHIAEVKNILPDQPISEFCNRFPQVKKLYDEKGWRGFHKEYHLGDIEELENPIPHRRGDPSRGQVFFYTTLDEIRKAKTLSDIRTLAQLEALRRPSSFS